MSVEIPEDGYYTYVSPAGARTDLRICEVVTPEEIQNRLEAFKLAIAPGETPQAQLKLGAEHLFEFLAERYEKVSLGKLRRELIAQLLLLQDSPMKKEALKILFEPRLCFSFFEQSDLLGKVKCYWKEFQGKIILQEALDDEVALGESLGRALNELPQTKAMVLLSNEPVTFTQLDICERGLVGLLALSQRPTIIKWTNSDTETEVAIFAGNQRLSPLVYEATISCLAEEAILDSYKIRQFKVHPEVVGQGIGIIMKKLHEAGIVYDNRFLDHVLVEVGPEGKARVRIIDLEAAGFSQNFQLDINAVKRELKNFYQADPQALEKALCGFEEAYQGKLKG